MKLLNLLILTLGLGLSLNAFTADSDAVKKQTLCGEKGEFKAAWTIGEAWGTSYLMTWFKMEEINLLRTKIQMIKRQLKNCFPVKNSVLEN